MGSCNINARPAFFWGGGGGYCFRNNLAERDLFFFNISFSLLIIDMRQIMKSRKQEKQSKPNRQ